MSFTLPVDDILQAAVNTLFSYYPIVAIFVGVVLAGFIISVLVSVIRAARA